MFNINMKAEPWSIKIGRVFGTPLAKLLAKLNVSPNIVTVFTVVCSIFAFICFFNGLLYHGALLFFINFVLDCADGELARITNTESDFGHKLDKYTDSFNTFILYLGLWYSLFYVTGNWLFGGVCFGAHYFTILFGKLRVTDWEYGTKFPAISSYYHPLDENFLTFAVLPVSGLFILLCPILIVAQFISFKILDFKQRNNKW